MSRSLILRGPRDAAAVCEHVQRVEVESDPRRKLSRRGKRRDSPARLGHLWCGCCVMDHLSPVRERIAECIVRVEPPGEIAERSRGWGGVATSRRTDERTHPRSLDSHRVPQAREHGLVLPFAIQERGSESTSEDIRRRHERAAA